ncbi:hypothetical protein BKA82DRAFT_4426120 [Pisolithus tinctorius]|nr:hypothetical protein BKA82DRAFT_4426119 [Pisolithus tinctorius]KAI6144723.1 hypothetical protein BKA82DRAFT_4426120 [Pisolithus tinctorius]
MKKVKSTWGQPPEVNNDGGSTSVALDHQMDKQTVSHLQQSAEKEESQHVAVLHRECHMDTPTPKSWPACKMQQLSRGGPGHALFAVHDSTTPIPSNSTNDTILHLKKEMEQVSTSGMQQDECIISPWLQATWWHENVSGHDIYHGLSPEALPGAAEDIIPLSLQASVQWQVIMHIVPGEVKLGYAHANPGQFQELTRVGKLGLEPQQEVTGARTRKLLPSQRTRLQTKSLQNWKREPLAIWKPASWRG